MLALLIRIIFEKDKKVRKKLRKEFKLLDSLELIDVSERNWQ